METNTENVIFKVPKEIKKDLLIYCAVHETSMQDIYFAYTTELLKSNGAKQRRRA
ncbi:MAG: hypothetical protein WC374_12050 [Phycisphaerae bacterium]